MGHGISFDCHGPILVLRILAAVATPLGCCLIVSTFWRYGDGVDGVFDLGALV